MGTRGDGLTFVDAGPDVAARGSVHALNSDLPLSGVQVIRALRTVGKEKYSHEAHQYGRKTLRKNKLVSVDRRPLNDERVRGIRHNVG